MCIRDSLSTKLGLEAIRAAKARGQKNIYVETCPQYLMLDVYKRQGVMGTFLKISLGSLCHKPHLTANKSINKAIHDRSAAKKYRLRQQTIR